jgi:hypothetical protein
MLNRLIFCVEALEQHPAAIKAWADDHPTIHLMGFYCDLCNLGLDSSMPGQIINMELAGRGATQYKNGNGGEHERRTPTGADAICSPAAPDV